MTQLRPITIVGGGLAGLVAGIGLRQRGVPVTIWEAGSYPRHKVCGEFISGNGQESLRRIGLLDKISVRGVRLGKTVAFFNGSKASRNLVLPFPALCVTRFELDQFLADEFRQLGGDLRVNQRWSGKEMGEGMVRATGRRIQTAVNGWRWFGLKVHARQVNTQADLEVHFLPDGYVGICRLPDGAVNVCGLFRSRTTLPQLAQQWPDYLKGASGSRLEVRLAQAEFDDDSFCAVSGLSLQPCSARSLPDCVLGDALTMIPPVTGNGMSMAFESAEIAIEPLYSYSSGQCEWLKARAEIAQRCDALFGSRLRWAFWTQQALFQRGFRSMLFYCAGSFPRAFQTLFLNTR